MADSVKLAAAAIAHDTTRQENRCCFAKDNIMVNHDWYAVARQMCLGSTWNGAGTAAYNGFALLGNALRFLANAFAALRYCCDEEKRSEHGWKTVASLLFMATNIKNIVYHIIRAIPIIGYPISRGIDKLALMFYEIECVNDAMNAVIRFGNKYHWNEPVAAGGVNDRSIGV